MGNYVAWLIAQNLNAKRKARGRTKAKPGDKRVGYSINVPITIPDRRDLEERARKEMRSRSSYVLGEHPKAAIGDRLKTGHRAGFRPGH